MWGNYFNWFCITSVPTIKTIQTVLFTQATLVLEITNPSNFTISLLYIMQCSSLKYFFLGLKNNILNRSEWMMYDEYEVIHHRQGGSNG